MTGTMWLRLSSGASVLYLGAALAALAYLAGRPLYARCTRSVGRGLEDHVLSIGLGSGVVAGALFLLGILGLWGKSTLVVLSLVGVGVGLWANRDLRNRKPSPSWAIRSLGRGEILLTAALVGMFVFWIPFLLSPEVFYDSLTNHLLLPAEWLRFGRMSALPSNCTSAFPSITELWYLLALAFADERLAKTVHGLFAAGAAAALFAIGRRRFSARAGLIASLLFFTLPIQGIEFGTTAVEFAATFYLLLTMLCVFRASEAPPDARPRWFRLAGAFAGLAAGTKYTMWVFPVAVAGAMLLCRESWGWSWRDLWRYGVVEFLGMSALVVSPWLIRNLAQFGNPVYPFLIDLFGPTDAAFYNRDFFYSYAVRSSDLGTWKAAFRQMLLRPFEGDNQLGWMGWALLLPLVTAPAWFRKPGARFVGALFALQWAAYGAVVHLVRYRLPSLALGAMLVGIALDVENLRRLRGFLTAAVLVAALANFSSLARRAVHAGGWNVGLGLMSKSDFLGHTRSLYAAPPYPALAYLNENTPPGAKILVVGESRVFHLERAAVSATVFDRHPLTTRFGGWASAAELWDALQRAGITYLMVNLAEASRLRGQWPPWPSRQRAAFAQFMQQHGSLVFEDRNLARDDFRHTLVFALADMVAPNAGTSEIASLLMSYYAGDRSTAASTEDRP